MFEQFYQHVAQYVSFNQKEKAFLEANLPIIFYKKGEHLLKYGEVSNRFFFNLQGCVRLYYLANGDEKTAYFYTESQFISSYESYVHQIPSVQSFQAIEDTSVLEITAPIAEKLLAMTPKFEILARMAMEEEMIQYQRLIASFISQSPTERYLNLLETHAELFQRIPQHYIASYLGVKPESLSRIKKKIYAKEKKS